MKTTYDISICYFQLISITSPRQIIAYMKQFDYRNSLHVSPYMISNYTISALLRCLSKLDLNKTTTNGDQKEACKLANNQCFKTK